MATPPRPTHPATTLLTLSTPPPRHSRCSVLMALSRKDFVGEVLDLLPDDRLEGTLAATAICAWQGARVFRAHDVTPTLRVLRMVDALKGMTQPVLNVRGLA